MISFRLTRILIVQLRKVLDNFAFLKAASGILPNEDENWVCVVSYVR